MLKSRTKIVIGIWLIAICLASLLDGWIATHFSNTIEPRSVLAHVLKMPGLFQFTLLVVVLVTLVNWKKPRWQDGAFIVGCGLLSGVNGIIKWLVGRPRPYRMVGFEGVSGLDPLRFDPMHGGISGLIGTRNLSFPSGHATLAFATAAGLAILFPRNRWIFYAVATLTAIERVAEGAHWSSDAVAAAGLGIAIAYGLAWAVKQASKSHAAFISTVVEMAPVGPEIRRDS